MKTTSALILASLLTVLSGPARAVDIGNYHSGSWFDPDRPGHGLSIEVVDAETAVIYWFTYHPDGTPMWLMSVAGIEGDTASGDAYYFYGMRFGSFDPGSLNQQRWGVISLTFLDCNSASLRYDSSMSYGGIPFGAGGIDLVRLTFIDGLGCPSQLPEGKFGNFSSGLAFDPLSGWPGNSFAWISRDGTLAYQYADDGKILEVGYGQLDMNGERTFDFDVTTSNGIRQGAGEFEADRVTLDLDGLGVLSQPLDPAFHDEIRYDDIAGEYVGPDLIWMAQVDETGGFEGFGFGGAFRGTLTLPELGGNQVVSELLFTTEDGVTGVNHGLGVYHRASGNLLFISNRGNEVWTMPWYRSQQ